MHKNGIKKIENIRNKVYNWGKSSTVTYNKYNRKLIGALVVKGGKLNAIKKTNKLYNWIKNNNYIEPYKLLLLAYLKISPVLQPRYIKIAGKMQPIAYGLMTENKRVTYGIKWTIKMLRDKHKTRSINIDKLGQELYDAICNRGEILQYKQQWQLNLLRNARKMPIQLRKLKTGKIHYS